MKNKIVLVVKSIILIASFSFSNTHIYAGSSCVPLPTSIKPLFHTTKAACFAVEMPSILFKFNSTQIYQEKDEDQKMYAQKVDMSIERAKKIFNEETSTVIEISGHCDSKESNKEKLSLARAKYIADELIKKGIPKKRIVIKGYAATQPILSEETINAAPNDEEKENLRLQNRRIALKILRWDYKEK